MGRGGEQRMVPRAEPRSYYGEPVLNGPVWKVPDVPAYLFLGGLAAGSSLLAAGADLTGRQVLSQRTKLAALAAISGSTIALVHDLGRPARFLNMLRTFKPTSPMSMGSWVLAAYGPAAGAAAASSVTGIAPRCGVAATAGAAALSPVLATYTAVLLANTAVPAWHEAHRELPYVFAGSGAAAAGGLAALLAPGEAGPARRLAAMGWAVEAAAVWRMERRLGSLATSYEQGRAGRWMRAGEVLAPAGVLATVLGRRRPALRVGGGAALMAASLCTRFGVFEAGRASAADPAQTVGPQRERLSAHSPT
ncbi:MAG TPA: NrfD/PsrC family molybdoenzyme membrane anchor subunit [Acidimicrobiales bacterium]|nr:NrfD/PsrC family molybdoenzyme membrane anchor subunit [Acidimicrobiales bacterium]